MASGSPQEQGPISGNVNLWQAFSQLPADRLACEVGKAAGYYDYLGGDPGGMDQLQADLEDNTPPLGALRMAFRRNFLTKPRVKAKAPFSYESEASSAEEFDRTLLSFYFCPLLRQPLHELDDPDLLASHLGNGTAIANRGNPYKDMKELKTRYLSLWNLSGTLAQTAVRRLKGVKASDPSNPDTLWKPSHLAGLAPEDQELFANKRWAQHVGIFTIAASLNTMREIQRNKP